MRIIKRSDPRAVERRLFFTCVDTLALQTRLQSSDMSTFTLKLTKAGGTPASAVATTPVQVGATDAKGVFYIELALADIDTVGNHVLVITNAGGTKAMEVREIEFRVDQAFFATAITGTLTTTTFTSDRTETTNNYWIAPTLVHALSGANVGQTKKIASYTGSNKLFTLAAGQAFTSAPLNGDLFELLAR